MADFDMNANALLDMGRGTVQPQNNLMPNIAQAAEVQNRLLDYKVRQSEYGSKLASGNALLGNTAADGSVNWAKARSDYAQAARTNPSLALGAADNYSANNTAQTGTAKASDADLAFQEHASEAAANGMGRVINDPSNTNLAGYGTLMSRLVPAAAGQIKTIVDQISSLPTKGQRQEALKAVYTAHMGQEASNRVFGTSATADDGSKIYGGKQDTFTGAFTPTSAMQKQVGPDSNAIMLPVTMKDPETGQMITVYRPAGELRQSNGSGNFTGRRINTAGGQAEPMSGTPTGYDEQYKTGQNVQNTLSAQQNEVTQNIATLRNLDALLSSPELKNVRSRTLKDIANNASKFGIDWFGSKGYATIAQEIDKAGTTLRKQMMDSGSGPHTNAGLSDLEHITPGMEMTPTAARALTNEILTAAIYKQGQQKLAASIKDPTKVLSALADYDQNFDPRFATIQRLGPEEGREYAKSHITDRAQYSDAVRRMARAQREKGYDYGLTPTQVDRILGKSDGR